MARDFKKIYVIAGVLSLILYVAGIATGYYLQGDITNIVASEVGKVRYDINSLDQEMQILSLRGQGSCSILHTLSGDLNERLNKILSDIINIEDQASNRDLYNDLVNDYTSLAVRAWILEKDISESCEGSRLPILYLYSVPCEECLEQGKIIDTVKEVHGDNISVFVVNSGVNQPAVNIIQRSFNITKTPSMIIGSSVYRGLVSEDLLEEILSKQSVKK